METVWVLGDQLNRRIGALAEAHPSTHRILLVESRQHLERRPTHRQRLHLVVTAMRRFAGELREEGFEVDFRQSPDMAGGLAAHRGEHDGAVVVTEPNSRSGRRFMDRHGVRQVASDQFLCHPSDFARWADGRKALRMEDFYRWQRTRLGYLMDGDEPVGGRWNYDSENREPPPGDGGDWPTPPTTPLDDIDQEVVESLPATAFGADPTGTWATDRAGALERMRHFVDRVLPLFGPHEDAMLSGNWHLAHSLLSPYLNLGLLMPEEVCDAVEDAYRNGGVPINSAEGFIRQVIGWREYVWGLYWLWPDHGETNHLGNDRDLPPAFTGAAATEMRCLTITLAELDRRAWVHHIPRLMVLSNLANLVGIHPRAVMEWMTRTYIDAAEWVMIPNVFGMGMWADGGRMATKPYVSGGAYINRMSDYCGDCRFDPRKRTSDDACPFTSLYWDFLARHEAALRGNHRMSRALAGMHNLKDLSETRLRAAQVIEQLDAGLL